MDDSEKNLISIFLSGLKEDLRRKVKLDKPLLMVAAYRSVCAWEMIAITEKRMNRFQPYKNPGNPTEHPALQGKNQGTSAVRKESNSANPVPIRRLTPKKIEEYRRKNLCFKCDEPFTYGHKNKNRSLMLIESEEVENLEEEEEILLEPKDSNQEYLRSPYMSWRAFRHLEQLD